MGLLSTGFYAGQSGPSLATALDPLSKRIAEERELKQQQRNNQNLSSLFQMALKTDVQPESLQAMMSAIQKANPNVSVTDMASTMETANVLKTQTNTLKNAAQSEAYAKAARTNIVAGLKAQGKEGLAAVMESANDAQVIEFMNAKLKGTPLLPVGGKYLYNQETNEWLSPPEDMTIDPVQWKAVPDTGGRRFYNPVTMETRDFKPIEDPTGKSGVESFIIRREESDDVLQTANEALDLIAPMNEKGEREVDRSLSVIYDVAKNFGQTNSATLETKVNTLKSRLSLDAINEMKKASPTGSTGLGAVSNAEGERLASKVAALDPKSKQAASDVIKIIEYYTRFRQLLQGQLPDNYEQHPTTGLYYYKDDNGMWQLIPGQEGN